VRFFSLGTFTGTIRCITCNRDSDDYNVASLSSTTTATTTTTTTITTDGAVAAGRQSGTYNI